MCPDVISWYTQLITVMTVVAELFPKFGAADYSTEISRLQAHYIRTSCCRLLGVAILIL
jgi:hypothetical protein